MEAVPKYRQQSKYGVSLILAPLLLAISSFLWINGKYGVVAGTLPGLLFVFWMPALLYVFGLTKSRMPNYSNWGLLMAMFGFTSRANFAFVGVAFRIFNISHQSYNDGSSRYLFVSTLYSCKPALWHR